jgi:hypothetical protein
VRTIAVQNTGIGVFDPGFNLTGQKATNNIPSMKRKISILVLLPFLIWGCHYDKEEELYGTNGACNTGNVTYSITVTSLLTGYGCIGCHSGSVPEGGVNLQGYDNAKAMALSGRLYGAISHAPGYQPMPYLGTKMAPCDIVRIKAWIDAGAPNN